MESISLQIVKNELQRLLMLYRTEATEGHVLDVFYWECAQDTVLDVAAALDVPLQEVQAPNCP